MNIPASGLRLRPEFSVVCDHANILLSSLITLQDLPQKFSHSENVRWILVDHNKLQGQLGEIYSPQVHGVIDHHEEEKAVPQETEHEPRIIEKCGSCTSLVVRYCKPTWDHISSLSLSSGAAHAQGEAAIDDTAFTHTWDAQIAKFALASILVDTANLTAPGKVEKVDIEAVEYLEAKICMSPKEAKTWNRDQYYHKLDEAEKDIGSLRIDEILIKDYKEWTENGLILGISSVVKPLIFLVEKTTGIEKEVQSFMESRNLSMFAIMTTSTSAEGAFQRELLLQAKEPASTVAKKFSDKGVSELKLEDLEVEHISVQDAPVSGQPWRRTWQQRDLSKSRKQVAPLLRKCMN